MIEKTTGIALRVAPFSNTSHIVTWLTPGHGKLATLVKGAQRPKSAFLGQYDLFYSCDILFYVRERNGVHIMKECSPIDSRTALRHDWRSAACASYLCDLVSRVIAPGAPNTELFDHLGGSLDLLAQGKHGKSFLGWFELGSLRAIGLSPQFDHCIGCTSALPEDNRDAFFSCSRGGVVCAECAVQGGERTMPLKRETLKTIQLLQKADLPGGEGGQPDSGVGQIEIRNLLGKFLEYHIPPIPDSRRIVMELLA